MTETTIIFFVEEDMNEVNGNKRYLVLDARFSLTLDEQFLNNPSPTKKLLLPVHVDNNHWIGVEIDQETVVFLSSFFQNTGR